MTDPRRLDVVIARRVAYSPWWGPIVRRLEKVVAMIPTHRDTRSGRRNAMQIRVALLGVGILTVALWESPWAPLALLACATALFVPLSRSKRRQILASLRSRRTKSTRVKRTSGTLEISDKHVTASVADERVRRLRVNQLVIDDEGDRLTLKVGEKKANRLIVCAGEGSPDIDAWVEDADVEALREAL